MEKMLKVTDVAKILNVSRQSVYKYIDDGKLKSVKFEGVVRVKQKDLEKFLEQK